MITNPILGYLFSLFDSTYINIGTLHMQTALPKFASIFTDQVSTVHKYRFCFCYLPQGECLSKYSPTYSLHFNVANKDWAIVLTLFSAMYYFYGAIPFPHISHAKRGSSLPLFSLGNCGKRWKVSEPSKPYTVHTCKKMKKKPLEFGDCQMGWCPFWSGNSI